MKTHLTLPINNNHKGSILHITDTHLFADENNTLLGINTNASFHAVVNEVLHRQQQFDLIVATGDFVQDGSQQGYAKFAQKMTELNVPCVWLAGNHDTYSSMSDIFSQYHLPDNKVILFGDKWLIILLNSQVEGKAYGFISDDELLFLTSTLKKYPNRYVALFLHHHPIVSGCQWLDGHCLKNSDVIVDIIKHSPNIKSIGWGHIHQQIDKMIHHCYAFSTPSTCVQFMPQCHNFKLAEISPGWRIIEPLPDGRIETAVYRLAQNLFLPDMSQNGY